MQETNDLNQTSFSSCAFRLMSKIWLVEHLIFWVQTQHEDFVWILWRPYWSTTLQNQSNQNLIPTWFQVANHIISSFSKTLSSNFFMLGEWSIKLVNIFVSSITNFGSQSVAKLHCVLKRKKSHFDRRAQDLRLVIYQDALHRLVLFLLNYVGKRKRTTIGFWCAV